MIRQPQPATIRVTASNSYKFNLYTVWVFDEKSIITLIAIGEWIAVIVKARYFVLPTVFAQRIDLFATFDLESEMVEANRAAVISARYILLGNLHECQISVLVI
jgi:hypothetical protein